jgi:hypothetical protein
VELDMAGISNYLKDAILNHILRGNVVGTSLAQPTTVYVALFTTDPTDAGTGTEVSGGSYARVPVTFGSPSGGLVSNDTLIEMPVATADWGNVTYGAYYDSSTAGNLLFHGPLKFPKNVLSGDQFIFRLSEIDISLD